MSRKAWRTVEVAGMLALTVLVGCISAGIALNALSALLG